MTVLEIEGRLLTSQHWGKPTAISLSNPQKKGTSLRQNCCYSCQYLYELLVMELKQRYTSKPKKNCANKNKFE